MTHRILAIETATKTCSVALIENGKSVALLEETKEQYSHAEQLNPFIQDLLRNAGYQPKDLTAVAVGKGPGSYTGLRIGVSSAKGLCYALNIPLVAVPTLKAMAMQVKHWHKDLSGKLLCPMIDARRMEVYAALYDGALKEIRGTQADIVDEHTYAEYLRNQEVIFFGDGAAKCREVMEHQSHASFVENINPSAVEVGLLGHEKLMRGEVEDVAYFEPYYLKEFVAGKPKKLVG